MALRLIEMVLPEQAAEEAQRLRAEQPVLEWRQLGLRNGEVLVRILLEAEQCEAVLDILEKQWVGKGGYRVVILPVEATLPRADAKEEATPVDAAPEAKRSNRISRQELYEHISKAAVCSRVYMATVALSAIVATIGLHHDSLAIVIGAMVIAPLLGPNVALALATTLGDLPLVRRAAATGAVGIAMAILLSTVIGSLVYVDPDLKEVASRTELRLGDVVLALASGSAGALAFTTGAPATLIGVMVAVALLPPLATFGLLLGGGHPTLAMGAMSLFLVNLICVNLAGVTTFLAQGIRPATWWEKDRAGKATRVAIGLWVTLLALLIGLIQLLRRG